MTGSPERRQGLEEQQRFETLLADISTQFINLPPDQIDSRINEAQRRICESFGLDLSSLWQWSADAPHFLSLTHLHAPPAGPVPPARMDAQEMFPWQFARLLRKETLVFASTDDLPPEAERDKESRRHFGIKSSVGLPLYTGSGPLIGILTFNTLREECCWTTATVNRLQLVAQIFSNALARKEAAAKILHSEARLTAALDIVSLGFYELGEGYRPIFLDDRTGEILGIAKEDEPNLREFWLAHIHPEDLPSIRERSGLVLNQGVDLFAGEYRYHHPRKGLTWLHHVCRVQARDAAGRAARVIGVMEDITERKEKEQSLEESKEALRNSQKDLRRLAGRLISTQEEELRRLSRELHDDLSQRLAVLAIEAGTLEGRLEAMELPLPDETLHKISRIKDQLISVSEDVHRISRQLHPTILDDLGLVRAIESACSSLQERENLVILFRHENVPCRMPNVLSLCVYRIVQEGLKNILRHSGAARCEMHLRGDADVLHLTVRDEGRGFDPAEVRNRPGLGITSMRERARLVRGTFAIESRPGRGTVIRVSIPLPGGDA
jgi:PAS domain S-box-containing protein